ncbi:DUF4401 domain-containing protein [Marinimicrobium locisalis]|uniref:DUF4401 domain-containing protein n=1 Tax=Marinimicrobium locisalis TaxID=546022 RepID=UPI00322182A6
MTPTTDPRPRLREAGIALQPASDQGPSAPWYLLVLQGIGGWLSALFLMGFVGLGFLQALENAAVAFVLGAALIGGAYALLRRPQSTFLEQLVLAFSLAGQLLVAYAIGRWIDDINALFWVGMLVLHTLLAVLMASNLHRIFSTLFAALSLFFLGVETGAPYLVAPLALALACGLWLNEFRYPLRREAIKSAAMGLTLALLVIQYLIRFPELLDSGMATVWVPHWLGEWLTGATLGYLAYWVVKTNEVALSSRTMAAGVAALIALCLSSSFAYGLTQGAVLFALGFAISHRLLTGLGIVSLLFSISTYYYRLDLTLLEKSATLLVLGLVFLALRALLRRCSRNLDGETAHA